MRIVPLLDRDDNVLLAAAGAEKKNASTHAAPPITANAKQRFILPSDLTRRTAQEGSGFPGTMVTGQGHGVV